ncbi:hypothetical protein VTO42DRAFT_7920 [Malbranchea cinnamomea]
MTRFTLLCIPECSQRPTTNHAPGSIFHSITARGIGHHFLSEHRRNALLKNATLLSGLEYLSGGRHSAVDRYFTDYYAVESQWARLTHCQKSKIATTLRDNTLMNCAVSPHQGSLVALGNVLSCMVFSGPSSLTPSINGRFRL